MTLMVNPAPRPVPCSPLRHHLAEPPPVLIDAEPYERLLLHPRAVPGLFLGMGDVPVFSLHDWRGFVRSSRQGTDVRTTTTARLSLGFLFRVPPGAAFAAREVGNEDTKNRPI